MDRRKRKTRDSQPQAECNAGRSASNVPRDGAFVLALADRDRAAAENRGRVCTVPAVSRALCPEQGKRTADFCDGCRGRIARFVRISNRAGGRGINRRTDEEFPAELAYE